MAATKMAKVINQESHKHSKPSSDKARVQFDFSKESLDKLDEIVNTINASTRAEVIRRALTLFTEVLAAEKRGAKILFRDSDGTITQIMPLF
jgi:metal-responsive CopG/Arc/MetJ family transcriptional regulator